MLALQFPEPYLLQMQSIISIIFAVVSGTSRLFILFEHFFLPRNECSFQLHVVFKTHIFNDLRIASPVRT